MRAPVTAMLLAILPSAACTGGADGGPKHYGAGVHDIESRCRTDYDSRYFRIDAESGGTFVMTISWDDSNGEDLDLYLEDPDDDAGLFEADDDIPPGDSPAQVQASLPAPMDLLATVECYDVTAFTGTITVP